MAWCPLRDDIPRNGRQLIRGLATPQCDKGVSVNRRTMIGTALSLAALSGCNRDRPPADTRASGRTEFRGARSGLLWEEGKNFEVVRHAAEHRSSGERTTVKAFFWYACPHCFIFEPHLTMWVGTRSRELQLEKIPVTYQSTAKAHARLHYVLQILDREYLKSSVYDAIYSQENPLAGKTEAETLELQLAFAVKRGITAEAFSQAWQSSRVDTALARADTLTRSFQIGGTPTVVINDAYRVHTGHAPTLDLVTALLDDLAVRSS